MSVALASMDSAYGLSRLAMSGISVHHHLLHLQQLQQHQHLHLQQQHHHHFNHQPALDATPSSSSPSSSSPPAALRFSVVNILRPDFGREAIAARPADAAGSGSSSSAGSSKTTPIKVTALPAHSPLALARDLSTLSSRHSHSQPQPQSQSPRPRPSHSPLELAPASSNLSRSASLESLASSRSSVAGSSVNSSAASTVGAESVSGESTTSQQSLWPAWIYCTRYSDRPSSGPRSRRMKRPQQKIKAPTVPDEKRPRTAFSGEQLAKLRDEFAKNKYLNEERRQKLSKELGLNEQQIKIWFQNKRAKIKKATGQKNPLAIQLMAQGLYNHSTVSVDEDGEEELSR